MREVQDSSGSCHVGLQLPEALSTKREPRQPSIRTDRAASRVDKEFERCGHDAKPEAIVALQWIIRRLAWEGQLAEMHARAGIQTYRWKSDRCACQLAGSGS